MEQKNDTPAPVTNGRDFMKAMGWKSMQATFSHGGGVKVELNPDDTTTVTDIPKPRPRGIR